MTKKYLIITLFTVFISYFAAASSLAQNLDLPTGLDISTQEVYQQSLTEIYTALPYDKKLQFEIFFYVNLDNGQKPLQSLDEISKQGLPYLLKLYPVVSGLENKGQLQMNGLTATGVIHQGQELINAWLRDQMDKASNEAARENLERQLEIVNKEVLTDSDLSAYSELWHDYMSVRFK